MAWVCGKRSKNSIEKISIRATSWNMMESNIWKDYYNLHAIKFTYIKLMREEWCLYLQYINSSKGIKKEVNVT